MKTSQRLNDLKDVIIKYPVNGDIQRWRSGRWVNESMPSGLGGTSVHSSLSNLSYATAGHTGFAATSHSQASSTITDWGTYINQAVKSTSSPTFAGLTLTGFTENLLMTNASGVVGSPTNLSYSEVESYTDIPTWTEPYNNTYQIYDAVHGIYDYAYPATRYKIYAYKIIGGTKYFSDASAEFLVYGPD